MGVYTGSGRAGIVALQEEEGEDGGGGGGAELGVLLKTVCGVASSPPRCQAKKKLIDRRDKTWAVFFVGDHCGRRV